MAKRKQFGLDLEARREESGREIERLFEAQLHTAQRPVARELPVERIQPNPFQARRTFAGIEELAQSIRSLGFVSRLRVRPHPDEPDQFQLVYGERRLRAAIAAGLKTVPCEVAEHPDDAMLEIGLAENIQREELNPIEEAQAFQRFIVERGYTQQRLADRIGKDINYVNRRLKLLETPADVQEMVARRPDTIVVAREIARLPDEEARKPLIEQVLQGELSTREVQQMLRADAQAGGDDAARAAPESGSASVRDKRAGPSNGQMSRAAAVGSGINLSLDRDIRTTRRIFHAWNRDVAQLDDAHYRQLLDFMTEHLEQVQQLMAGLEEHR